MAKRDDWSLDQVIRPNILTLAPYRCARDDYASQEGKAYICLDANENGYGPVLGRSLNRWGEADGSGRGVNGSDDGSARQVNSSATTCATIDGKRYEFQDLHRYPDPRHPKIKERVVALRRPFAPHLTPDHVFLGVGSDEVIDLLIRITCQPRSRGAGVQAQEKDLMTGDVILTCPPTYGMYKVCATVSDVHITNVPLLLDGRESMFTLDVPGIKRQIDQLGPRVKLVFACSPGNPTGTLIPRSQLIEVLEYPGFKGILVVDEAYIEFSEGSTATDLASTYPNILLMQTLSKSFGLAAIRLGIAIAQPGIIHYMSAAKAPYNISTPTAVLALEALSDRSIKEMRERVQSIVKCREWVTGQLKTMQQQNVYALGPVLGGNHANFVLVQISDPTTGKASNERASRIYKMLADHLGLVVRYRGSEQGCTGCLRVSIGTDLEMKTFIERFKEALRQDGGHGPEVNGSAKTRELAELTIDAS